MLDELLTRARASSSAPPYICPTDRSPLTARRGEHFCAKCNKRFRQDELGIVCLDLIRSPEAVAFDERAIETALPKPRSNPVVAWRTDLSSWRLGLTRRGFRRFLMLPVDEASWPLAYCSMRESKGAIFSPWTTPSQASRSWLERRKRSGSTRSLE